MEEFFENPEALVPQPPKLKYIQLPPKVRAIVDSMIQLVIRHLKAEGAFLDMSDAEARSGAIQLLDAGIIKLWMKGNDMGWALWTGTGWERI